MEALFNDLLAGGIGNVTDVIVYLGWSRTPREKEESSARALPLLRHYEVIPTREVGVVLCPVCGEEMGSKTDRNRGLGWRYRCPQGHQYGPLLNTFLHNVRLQGVGAHSIVKLIGMWIDKIAVTSAQRYANVSSDTAVAWYSYCRDVAYKVAWHEFHHVGGHDDVVEVDETHLFKRKYNVGRQVRWNHVWLFGGISRTEKKVFGFLVQNRNRETLE